MTWPGCLEKCVNSGGAEDGKSLEIMRARDEAGTCSVKRIVIRIREAFRYFSGILNPMYVPALIPIRPSSVALNSGILRLL